MMEVRGQFSAVYQAPLPEQAEISDSGVLSLFANVSNDLLGTGDATVEFTVDGKTYRPFTNYGVRVTPGDPDFIRKGYPGTEGAQTTAFGISGELELNKFSRDPGAVVSGVFRLQTEAFENSTVAAHGSD